MMKQAQKAVIRQVSSDPGHPCILAGAGGEWHIAQITGVGVLHEGGKPRRADRCARVQGRGH